MKNILNSQNQEISVYLRSRSSHASFRLFRPRPEAVDPRTSAVFISILKMKFDEKIVNELDI